MRFFMRFFAIAIVLSLLVLAPTMGLAQQIQQRTTTSPSQFSREVAKKGVRLKTWRTIKLGTGLKTADDFRRAIQAAGDRISDCGNDILNNPAFRVSPKETEIELVLVTVAELGLKDGATRADIYKRAQEFGLELCPNEVGPQLRLQYWDQPLNEWVVIAMRPIVISDGSLNVFNVERLRTDSTGWLGGRSRSNWKRNQDSWDAYDLWVFARRK